MLYTAYVHFKGSYGETNFLFSLDKRTPFLHATRIFYIQFWLPFPFFLYMYCSSFRRSEAI